MAGITAQEQTQLDNLAKAYTDALADYQQQKTLYERALLIRQSPPTVFGGLYNNNSGGVDWIIDAATFDAWLNNVKLNRDSSLAKSVTAKNAYDDYKTVLETKYNTQFALENPELASQTQIAMQKNILEAQNQKTTDEAKAKRMRIYMIAGIIIVVIVIFGVVYFKFIRKKGEVKNG